VIWGQSPGLNCIFFLSQVISIVVVQSFGEIYRLHFTVFPDTLLGTVLFFGLLFLWMGITHTQTESDRDAAEQSQRYRCDTSS
jgi:hypothetical protein